MKNFISAIVDFILQRGKIISVVILLLTLFFGYQLRNLSVYGEFDVWYKSTDPILKVYEEYIKAFGNDENIVLIYSSDSLFSEYHFNYNRELTQRITALEGIREVISLSTIKIPVSYGIHTIMKPLIPEHSSNPEDLFRQVSGMPILVNNLISRDGKSTGIVIFPEEDVANKKILSQVETIAGEIRAAGYQAHIFGPLSIKEEVHQLANREAGRFLLIAIVIMIGLLYLILKKLVLAILPVFLALITVVWTLGIFVLSGKTMNVITSVMPLVLLVVSIAFSIHFIFSFRKSGSIAHSQSEIFQLTFRDVLLPCFYSGLTTSAAFLVFGLSDINPLVVFGVFSAIGVIIAFVLTFLLLPTLFRYFKLDKTIGNPVQAPSKLPFHNYSSWVDRNRKLIIITSMVVLIISILGISRIEFSADQLRYFKKSNPVTLANHAAEEWFDGIYPTEIILELKKAAFEDPNKSIRILEKIESEFEAFEEISSWQSPLVVFKSILPGEGSRERWVQYMRMMSGSQQMLNGEAGGLLGHYISEDGKKMRISIRTRWMDSEETLDFIHRLGQSVEASLAGENTGFHFTGMTSMLSTMSKRLTRSQMVSIVGALTIIFLLLLLIYRKLSISLVGMIPNVFPVITTIGIMGWLGIPLDVATVLLASISLGIAIDDTIHFLTVFQDASKTKSTIEAVTVSYNRIGKPITITTLLLIGGFLVMVFSNYIPIIYLGIFVSINVFLALVYDLVLLPALLLTKK